MEQRYEYLYGQELQEHIARRAVAWVPLGILERHGEHLPYGLDGFKAHGVCMKLATLLGGVVLPATHLSGVHSPWRPDVEGFQSDCRRIGNMYLRLETLRMLVEDVVDGLANIGFETIVLYTGHYPKEQVTIMREVADQRTSSKVARVIAFHEPLAMDGQGDHAGKCETSFYMALDGEVRLDAIKPEHTGKLGFFAKSGPGPKAASREFGEAGIEAIHQWFKLKLNPPILKKNTNKKALYISTNKVFSMAKKHAIQFKVDDSTAFVVSQPRDRHFLVINLHNRKMRNMLFKYLERHDEFAVIARQKGSVLGDFWNICPQPGKSHRRCLLVEGAESMAAMIASYSQAWNIEYDFYFFSPHSSDYLGYFSHHEEVVLYFFNNDVPKEITKIVDFLEAKKAKK